MTAYARRFLRYAAVVITLFANDVRADDCKPVTQALAQQLYTPFDVKYHGVKWDRLGHCAGFGGFGRHPAGLLSFGPYEQAADAFPKVLSCRRLETTTIDGKAADHFYAAIEADAARRLYTELWISSDTGRIFKRSETTDDQTMTIEYDYESADRPGFISSKAKAGVDDNRKAMVTRPDVTLLNGK